MILNNPTFSRAEILLSAQMAFLSGKTINDCPLTMLAHEALWRHGFQQAQFELACSGD